MTAGLMKSGITGIILDQSETRGSSAAGFHFSIEGLG